MAVALLALGRFGKRACRCGNRAGPALAMNGTARAAMIGSSGSRRGDIDVATVSLYPSS